MIVEFFIPEKLNIDIGKYLFDKNNSSREYFYCCKRDSTIISISTRIYRETNMIMNGKNFEVTPTRRPRAEWIPIVEIRKTLVWNIIRSSATIYRSWKNRGRNFRDKVVAREEKSSVAIIDAGKEEDGCCSVLENIAGITRSRKNRMKLCPFRFIKCKYIAYATPVTIIDNKYPYPPPFPFCARVSFSSFLLFWLEEIESIYLGCVKMKRNEKRVRERRMENIWERERSLSMKRLRCDENSPRLL